MLKPPVKQKKKKKVIGWSGRSASKTGDSDAFIAGTFEEDLETLIERDRAVYWLGTARACFFNGVGQMFGDRLTNTNIPMIFQRALASLTKNGAVPSASAFSHDDTN